MEDRLEGAPPLVDVEMEKRVGNLVRDLIRAGTVNAAHDVSDGGALVAVAEMALAGGTGVSLETPPPDLPAHALWFGEDQARFIVAASPKNADAVHKAAVTAGVAIRILGTAGGDALTLEGNAPVALNSLRSAHEAWLPRFMTGG
jgi:phosphoribosylformylglycinamidine (FGAM) synthase-like enzyme